MVISLWMVFALAVAAATLISNRVRASAVNRKQAGNRKTPSDQIRPQPRHVPLVASQVYS
jgi:hypothetical protein